MCRSGIGIDGMNVKSGQEGAKGLSSSVQKVWTVILRAFPKQGKDTSYARIVCPIVEA